MALTTQCPHCEKQYTLADDTLDKNVKCKECEFSFTVRPGVGRESQQQFPASLEEPSPDQSPLTNFYGGHDRPEEGTRFTIPERYIRNFITCNEVVLTAGFFQRDIQDWFIWFNYVRHYLITTDIRIVIIRRSLWRFARIFAVVNYEDLHGIHVSHSKKKGMHLTSRTQYTKIQFRFSDGNSMEIKTLNHMLVQSLCASLEDRVKLTTEQL
jgi:predicted Zn finger-like uncharacterized protein